MKRTCWSTGSWRSCLSLDVVISIPVGSTIIYRFLCGFICVSLWPRIKIKATNMYITSARAQFKINTHRCWNWHQCIPDGLSVVKCSIGACHWSCYFWRNFSGVKRTCRSTGSWRIWLSLVVLSSIPAGSMLICRFLCGFLCVSWSQSNKIKPTNMYIASARAQFKIDKHRCRNWHLCNPDGFSIVQCSLGHVIGVAFFYVISVEWSARAGQLAAGGVALVWRSWVRSPQGPR